MICVPFVAVGGDAGARPLHHLRGILTRADEAIE
jgi:hypothetical protein